ncbi:glycosyltransferase [Rhodobacteraceae bacterium CCMM004]|nr:glycosyltransferase [Rhodobacteraceae bacterium CCMM004]
MGRQGLHLVPTETAAAPIPPRLGELLVADGVLSPTARDWALHRQGKSRAPLGRILTAHGLLDPQVLARALARQRGLPLLSPADCLPGFAAIDRLGPAFCAREGILPLARGGAAAVVATSDPARFPHIRDRVEAALGPVSMAVVAEPTARAGLAAARQHRMVARAEARTDTADSCRDLAGAHLPAVLVAIAAATGAAVLWAPLATFSVLAIVAIFVTLANAVLNAAAALASMTPRLPRRTRVPLVGALPSVSILVPLYRERAIAGPLISRLSRLDYPRELLEICLVTEASDTVTRATAAAADLPPWMHLITVPDGALTTKPRAMNYALDFLRGEVVGVYDAEDAPAPDQIRLVARQFRQSPPRVACLQGRLNFYNARATWISRCFTIEYATWFGVTLPGLRALGLPLPLGGTTLFFRRTALEDVGAWDAHNVTEDADLGMRLARRGYVTDILDSTTLEEAACHPLAWIRQRSRWLKGFAVTYAVHMRRPLRLWADLGAYRFLGMQMLFLGTLLGFLLAPILWTFWLLFLDLPHPWRGHVPSAARWALGGTLFMTFVLTVVANVAGLARLGRPEMWRWIPALQVYFVMASIALAKALIEAVVRPFFWDKTAHGVSPPDAGALAHAAPAQMCPAPIRQPRPPPRRA